jgi:nitroreductase
VPERQLPTAAECEPSLLEGLASARSIHRYRPDPIPDADLSRILWSATRAPSGSNAQPFRFLVLRDGPRAARAKALLGESFRASWAAKASADGWERGPGADPATRKGRTARAMQEFVDRFEEIPVVVLACALRHREPNPFDGASVYPACQNLLLAARALGYGSTITLWHVGCEVALRDLLGIPPDVWIAATLPLGRPVGGHGPLRRRPVAELVWDDAWESPAAWVADPPGSRHSSPRSASATRFAPEERGG